MHWRGIESVAPRLRLTFGPPTDYSDAVRVSVARLTEGLIITAALTAWAGCGSAPPAPTPVPALPGPVQNAPPVIVSLTTSAQARMEVEQDVAVAAVVTDAEVAVSKLTLIWSASIGTISGSGLNVTWRLPKGSGLTPADVTITLTVVEQYDNVDANSKPIVSENRVSRSTQPFRVHDSDAELTKMAVHFLVDLFGNSTIGADACVVDFSDTCPGKKTERDQIASNRHDFLIFSGSANVTGITYAGPKASATSANIVAPCSWHDEFLATGKTGVTSSTCFLSAVYVSQRWWLCTSTIDPNGTCGSCPTIAGSSPGDLTLTRGRPADVPAMTIPEFFLRSVGRGGAPWPVPPRR